MMMHRLQKISLQPRQILEKTPTEIYNDLIVEHFEVKVSQRCFEKLRPHYVKPATKKDQMSCLCRIHVEANTVFKAFMRLRCRLLGKQFAPEKEGNTEATDKEDHEPIENVKIYHKDFHIWLMIHCVQKVIMNTTSLYALNENALNVVFKQLIFQYQSSMTTVIMTVLRVSGQNMSILLLRVARMLMVHLGRSQA